VHQTAEPRTTRDLTIVLQRWRTPRTKGVGWHYAKAACL